MTLLFFDASCLIAASGSPTGGSAFLLALCVRQLMRAAVSEPVLIEAERNVRLKLGQEALVAYHHLLDVTPFVIAPIPLASSQEWQRLAVIAGAKDTHVLAAADAIRATYVLTLDKLLEARINEADLRISALSPKRFIQTLLPTHPDYPTVR
ncbi:MAG: PIN domain-containing protein [Chloroflexota bacterium]